MQASSILSLMIVVGVETSQFLPLHDTPPMTTIDVLHVVGC
jgi:hypothetical protein